MGTNQGQAEGLEGVSPQDVESFAKHMKDPKFVQLFEDYAKEISDPQALAEHEQYLQQLESEGQDEAVYGKGVQLIVPQPAFVVKTKDAQNQKRVYINICTCAKVGKMAYEVAPGPPPRRHLQLPMLLNSKPKQGQAADGGAVEAWDLVLHPDGLAAAKLDPVLCNTIIEMAIERLEQASSKLLRSYKLPGVTYKSIDGSGKPAVMALRTEGGGHVVDGRLRPAAPSSHPSSSTDSTPAAAAATAAAPAGRSSFSFGSKAPPKPPGKAGAQQQAAEDPRRAGHRHACGAVTPAWQLVERGRVDLGRSWGDSGRALGPITTQPEALAVRVELPGVTSPGQVVVDVSPDGRLLDVAVPGRFLLRGLALPWQVADGRGTAKFNKAKQQLELTLPTVPPEAPEQQGPCSSLVMELAPQAHEQQQEQRQQQPADAQEQEQGEQSVGPAGDAGPCCANQQAVTVAVGAGGAADHSTAKSANQQRWQELHNKADAVVAVTNADKPKPDQQQQQQQVEEEEALVSSRLKPRFAYAQVAAADLD